MPGLLERRAARGLRQGAVLAVRAMLAAEEAAARGCARLRASLDPSRARREGMVQAGTEKRRFSRTEKRGKLVSQAWCDGPKVFCFFFLKKKFLLTFCFAKGVDAGIRRHDGDGAGFGVI